MIQEPGFVSASTGGQTKFDGNVHFTIRSLSAKSVQCVAVCKDETEVIFKTETKFKVISKTKTPSGQWQIQLEEVP